MIVRAQPLALPRRLKIAMVSNQLPKEMQVHTQTQTQPAAAVPAAAETETADAPAPTIGPRAVTRILLAIVLLAVGGVIWWIWADRSGIGRQNPLRTVWLFICIVIAVLPPTRNAAARILDRLRTPSPRTQRLVMLGLAIGSVIYLLVVARMQQRDFVPRFHDEFMHLVQMRMLAEGKLWMPPHELADFFDTFHVLVRPVYASIYFPGTALLYVPAIWLNLPPWVMPLLAAALSVALIYRIVTELVGGVAGVLAAMLLLSLQMFRFLSIMVMSHGAMLLMGLCIVWAFLNWRRRTTLGWAAILGAFCGWAAITRPFDAIACVVPVAVAMLFHFRGFDWRRRITTAIVIIAAASPFLTLQLIENVGVTGNLFQTPYQFYAQQDSPSLQVGFSADRTQLARPLRSQLPQKREFYELFLKPTLQRHQVANILDTFLRRRLSTVTFVTLFTGLLVLLAPMFVLARATPRAAVLWAMLPLYLIMYTAFPFMLEHYAIVAAPAMTIIICLALRGVIETVPWPRGQRAVEVGLAVFLLGIAIPPIKPTSDDGYPMANVVFAGKYMPQLVHKPAIVLFHYQPGGKVHEEPVFNIDAAWPDDEAIIRAHDLGWAKDLELFNYYAVRQPQRTVYRFDRMNATLTHIGNVVDLAHMSPDSPPPAWTISRPTTAPTTTPITSKPPAARTDPRSTPQDHP